jgi:hypothetical protein
MYSDDSAPLGLTATLDNFTSTPTVPSAPKVKMAGEDIQAQNQKSCDH